jgi:anti-anti-sigma factor
MNENDIPAFEITDGKLKLSGNLTLDTVKSIYIQSLPLAQLDELPQLVDLKDVNRVDSSGLALLLEWQSWAIGHDHHFCYCNVPEKLLKLASLCGATEVLNMVCCTDEK